MLISLYFSPRISNSVLWSLFGLYFGTILRNTARCYGIYPYDRIAAGAGKETPQIRGFRQAAVLQVPFAALIQRPCRWRKYAVCKVFVFRKSSVWVLSGRYSVLQSVHQIYPKRILSEAGFGACFFFCTFHKTGAAVLCRKMIFLLIWTYFIICCTNQCNKTRCRRCK